VLLCLSAKEARTKQGECRALVVKGHIRNPRYQFKLLPAVPLVLSRRYLIVVLRPLREAPLIVHPRYFIVVPRTWPRCASKALGHGAQANTRGAEQILDHGAQAAHLPSYDAIKPINEC